MKQAIFLLVTLSMSIFVQGQKAKSIEIDFITRYDKHADYTTRYFDRSFTNAMKLRGVSYGSNVNFLQSISNKLKLKIGVGYYQLGINKIEQTGRFNLIAPERTIDFTHPTGIKPLFASDYYRYHNFIFTSGLAFEQKLKKNWNYNMGVDFNYLYTFAQFYNINYDNSKYRTNNGKTLGFGVNAYLGLIRKFNNNKFYINPKTIIPVYQQLHGDQVFGEYANVKMDKRFNGIGLSFAIGKYL